MNRIRQILRLHHQGHSNLTIATQIGLSRNTLKKYLKIYKSCGQGFDELSSLSDKELEELFIKTTPKPVCDALQTLLELFPEVEKSLKRKGVTRKMLWEQYHHKHPDGYGLSQFKHYYALWKAQRNPVMHIEHKAGDKMYVDFAGDKLRLADGTTVEVFVAILGCSQYTYVEAVATQNKEDFIAACENALHYYGGVPLAIVPDNLKSAVTKSSKYEPVIGEAFSRFAEHYATAILPARAYRPRDKALVENAVRLVYNRIYTRIAANTYTTLEELNTAILAALKLYNDVPLTGRDQSRLQQFEELEQQALTPLPAHRFELKKQCWATVAKNGHVALGVDKHYYSVPYRFIGKKVKLLYCKKTVEVFYHYERIALHERMKGAYHYTTDKEHLASTHRFVSEWTAERFISWAENIHEDVKLYILKVLDRKQHPEQAYKACLGILSLAKKVGNERLTNACNRALGYGSYSYKTIENILQRELDLGAWPDETNQLNMPEHNNIRGEDYYR